MSDGQVNNDATGNGLECAMEKKTGGSVFSIAPPRYGNILGYKSRCLRQDMWDVLKKISSRREMILIFSKLVK